MLSMHRNNLQSFCRTCLEHLDSTSETYFHVKHTPSLAKLLIFCTALNINEDTDAMYPQKLCKKCYDTMQQFHEFRNMAQQSAEVLQKIVENEDPSSFNHNEFESETDYSAHRLERVKIEIEDTILQENNFMEDFGNYPASTTSSNNGKVPKKLQCTFAACNRKFTAKKTLDNHLKIKHANEKTNTLKHRSSKINKTEGKTKKDNSDGFEQEEKLEPQADQPTISSSLQLKIENYKGLTSLRKRGNSFIDADDIDTKRLCEELACGSYNQHAMRYSNQFKNNLPITIIDVMYILDLSVLCSLRYSSYEQKNNLLSLTFNDSNTEKFNNIVFLYEGNCIRVQIENVDQYYTDNTISYGSLFPQKSHRFSVIDYFNSFVKIIVSNLPDLSYNIEYLIVYTNTSLDLMPNMKLKKGRFKDFYPFEFKGINLDDSSIIKEFLLTNYDSEGHGFYQFSQNKTTREEFLKRLNFSTPMGKIITEKKFSQECQTQIKEMFLSKLVFAVKQPNRENLNSIVKSELKNQANIQEDYMKLQKGIFNREYLNYVKPYKFSAEISDVMYEFKLLMTFLNSMFLHKNLISINFSDKSHVISINNDGRITYVKALTSMYDIDFSTLFPNKKTKSKFSINESFAIFLEKLEDDIENFIIYTNAHISLTEDYVIKKGVTKDFYRLKFEDLNLEKRKYEFLKNSLYFNKHCLLKIAPEDLTRKSVLSLLKLPPFFQKEKQDGRLSKENEKKLKTKFLSRLIFAVDQFHVDGLDSLVDSEIVNSNVPYNQAELNEVTLRWLESHGLSDITEEIMKKLFEDITSNRSSYQKSENYDIEKVKFVKRVIGKEGTTAFNQLLLFLTQGDGKKYLDVLNENGINLTNVSSILTGARGNASVTFKGLYEIWFDEDGNKTNYLKTLETKEINLASISSILNGVGSSAPKAFKELFDLWFPREQHKTKYLNVLEKEQISLSKMSSILSGAGINAARAFKVLYDLWFDEKGNKTQMLKTLERNGINLSNVSSIIGGAGASAANAFIGLYNLWFDVNGSKTIYLRTLEENEINLTNITSILGGAGNNGPKAFKDLYNLWFDERGNKTIYLTTLEIEGINPANLSSILNKSRSNAAKVFKDLYDLWFDEQGNKTKYLKDLEKENVRLCNMSGVLTGAGANAANVFLDLYNRLFDENGNEAEREKLIKNLKKER